MDISCCAWALPGNASDVLDQLRDLGLQKVDLRPFAYAGEADRQMLGSHEMEVTCIAASAGLHEDLSLEANDAAIIDAALQQLDIAFEYAASLGAPTAYIVPEATTDGFDPGRYADALAASAESAQRHGVRLAVEHFPGRALPTVAATLELLNAIDHPNLYLLFDSGHAQMSGEDPVAAIAAAGSRLGYVHLDDNNGVDDQHLGLLDGVMTAESLRRTLEALPPAGYRGPVSLELNANLSDPAAALRSSLEILRPSPPMKDAVA